MVCVQRNSIKKWSCVQVCVATQLCSAHEGANWEMSCEGKTYAKWSFSCAECVLQVCKEDGYWPRQMNHLHVVLLTWATEIMFFLSSKNS